MVLGNSPARPASAHYQSPHQAPPTLRTTALNHLPTTSVTSTEVTLCVFDLYGGDPLCV